MLFAQWGGAIYNEGTVTVKYGNFAGNSAYNVCVIAPHSQRSQLVIFLPGISQLFFSFLTFLLLFAQDGGAISNYGTLHVTLANFTRNQAVGGAVSRLELAETCSKSLAGI